MSITMLNLTDLDNIIRSLEKLYRVSSLDMLRDEAFRAKTSEDVLLKWETYVNQRAWLRDSYEKTHREYLSQVRVKDESSKSPSDAVAFAA